VPHVAWHVHHASFRHSEDAQLFGANLTGTYLSKQVHM
jgi:hypothetical protein